MNESTLKIEHVRHAVKELRATEQRLGELATMLEARLEGSETTGEQHKRVIAAFVETWAKRYGQPYVFAGGKDATAVKRLLKVLPAEEIIGRIARYVTNNDPFYEKVKHSLSMFASTINQHGDALPEQQSLSGAVGCGHRPRCRSDVEHTRKTMAELRA